MSEPLGKLHHEGTGFEREDMSPKAVYAFLIGLAVAGALVFVALWGMYRVLDTYGAQHQQPQGPLVQASRPSDQRNAPPPAVKEEIQKTIPEPRLEENERNELNEVRMKEEEQLNSYGWVDQNAGVAHIPIDRAMQLVVQQGLPTQPRVGTAPSSTVEIAKQAGARSDTSNLPGKNGAAAKEPKK